MKEGTKEGFSECLDCSVCYNPMKLCMALPCGHSFCDECVNQLVDKECPECRQSFGADQVVPNYIVRRLLAALEPATEPVRRLNPDRFSSYLTLFRLAWRGVKRNDDTPYSADDLETLIFRTNNTLCFLPCTVSLSILLLFACASLENQPITGSGLVLLVLTFKTLPLFSVPLWYNMQRKQINFQSPFLPKLLCLIRASLLTEGVGLPFPLSVLSTCVVPCLYYPIFRIHSRLSQVLNPSTKRVRHVHFFDLGFFALFLVLYFLLQRTSSVVRWWTQIGGSYISNSQF